MVCNFSSCRYFDCFFFFFFCLFVFCFCFCFFLAGFSCFVTSLRVLYDSVSVLAHYFYRALTFIGQGIHIFLSSASIRVAWLPTQYSHSLFRPVGIIDDVGVSFRRK